jgi:hypothetical protein
VRRAMKMMGVFCKHGLSLQEDVEKCRGMKEEGM